MACYYPIDCYKSASPNENGKYPLIFGNAQKAQRDDPMKIPCGRCHGCRLEGSRQWATRCYHESKLHEENSFLTLTYAPEHLPEDHSISKREVQLFLKKLRKQLQPKKIRFFACGEYGESEDQGVIKLERPHYHLLIFGHEWTDKKFWDHKDGNDIFVSENLTNLWGKGHCTIGEVNYKTAAYCARYIMKKIGGDEAFDHYQRLDEETGEIQLLEPEFTLQSRRPGIGEPWYQKYKADLNKGFITIDGSKSAIPKYYVRLMEKEEDPTAYLEHQEAQRISIDFDDPEYSFERLRIREEVKLRRIKLLKRNL
ncbi:replication initiator protein [Microviridae sp.]|nr:replication initiator protein [Microviridae sp.]